MSRLYSLMFIVVSVVALASSATAAPNFSDTSDHWAQSDIQTLASAGLVSGTGDGEFKPYDYMSRETFVALMHAVSPSIDVQQLKVLQQLPQHPWKASVAVSADPVASDISHEPRYLTRSEALALTAEMANLPLESSHHTRAILSQYTDAGQVPQWQQPYVATAIQQQWVHPVFPNKHVLHAQQLLRRGEAAYLINRLRQTPAVSAPTP